MALQRTLLGSSLGFAADGAAKNGRAPAKATAGSLSAGQGKLIGRWTLPDDPMLSTVLGYFRPVSDGQPVAFPQGSSPDENLGKVGKWQIEEPPVGQLVDAWVVTTDKFGNPTSPTAANALYLGRSRITSTKQQKFGSGAFA